MSVAVLDGRRLSAARAPALARRAGLVRAVRGRPPGLLLMAFGDEQGRVPHVRGKLRALEAAGVVGWPLLAPAATDTRTAIRDLERAIALHSPDGVFVQIPVPEGVDADSVVAAVPPALDVDIMTDERAARYMGGTGRWAPVTVEAGLLLLDDSDVAVNGLHGVVVADPTPFAMMLREAFVRRGARMSPLLDPADARLRERVAAADLVVAAAGRPGLLNTGMLAAGAIAIDVGYFNEGGRGDIDVTPGIDHLSAVMPVPGGIGPMTVSALVERVILFAEQGLRT